MSSWTALSRQGGLVDASDGLSGQSQSMRIRSGIQCLFADEVCFAPSAEHHWGGLDSGRAGKVGSDIAAVCRPDSFGLGPTAPGIFPRGA